MKAPWLRRLGELVAGGVFLYAGALKTLDPAGFAQDIDHYRLLPATAASVLALYLPWVEVLAGGALLLGRGKRGARLVLLMLSVVFLGAVSAAWARGLDITCGCFGAGGTSLRVAFLRDCGLVALLLVVGGGSPAKETPPS